MYQGLAYDIAEVMPEALDTGLFVSLCTIQMPTNQQTADGSPVNAWVNVGGLVNIPCMDAPEAAASILSAAFLLIAAMTIHC